ncbi:FRIGIDA-like protein 5 isoform X1 [Euphorbia lathyris]|uniref:FRIGIDA-like protein 5 isoform X1 n=1 Tax=Euphorbia lathyris TaxID=212925 RepID=UPI0033135169
MEAVVNLIKLAELKQQSFRKSFDEAHSQASSMLSLTLHLKDFEDQFELAKESLLKQAQELDLEAKKIVEAARVLEKRNQEVEVKLQKLNNLQSEDYHLVLVQEQLNSIRKEVEDCNGMLSMKKDELTLVQVKHEECSSEYNAKRDQLDTIERSIEEYRGKLKLDETKLDLVRLKFEECCKDLYVKNVELASVEQSLALCSTELEVKVKEVESARISATNCDEELELKQKELSMIKNSINDCDSQLELKRKQLRRLQKWTDKYSNELTKVKKLIEETSNDYNSKEKHLESIKVLIEDYAGELEAKEKQHDAIKNSIDTCSTELSMKQKELDSIDNSTRENSSELGLKKKKLEQLIKVIKSKEESFNSLKETMKTWEGHELKLIAVQESIRERNEELACKENLLKSVQTSIIESTEELESMKKQQNILKISVTECSEELESKRKSLDLVERSLKECGYELTSKKAELESLQRTCGLQKELEEREEYLDSLKTTFEKKLEKLQMKDREFEASMMDLELRERKINLMQKSIDEYSKQLEHKEKQLNDRSDGRSLQLILNENLREHDSILTEIFTAIQKSPDPGKLVLDAIQGFYPADLKNGNNEFSLSVIRRSCTTLIGQLLKISPEVKPEVREEAMRLALDWKSRMKALAENSQEVLAYLQLLAAFKLGSSFSSGELQSSLDVIYQNKQALELQQALGLAESLSDEQNPVQAHKTVNSSTAKVQSGSTIFNMVYPLILDDCMDNEELMPGEALAALKLSLDPAKFVLDLLQGSYSQHCEYGGSGLDTSVAKSIVVLLRQLIYFSPKISSMVKEEAIKLAALWKPNVTSETAKEMEIWAFLLFLFIYGLFSYYRGEIVRLLVKLAPHKNSPEMCRLLGLTDKIPELIRILIQSNQHIEAARFSCAFGLIHNFPLDIILQKCMEHLRVDAQVKAAERELNALKAIFQCITDYKLESIYDAVGIFRRISELEKRKTSSIFSTSAPAAFLRSDNYVAVSDNQPSPLVPRQLHNQNVRNAQSNNFVQL